MNAPQMHLPSTGPTMAEEQVELFQNSPNPFIEMTQLRFRLSRASEVVFRLFDATGQEVITKKGRTIPANIILCCTVPTCRKPGCIPAAWRPCSVPSAGS